MQLSKSFHSREFACRHCGKSDISTALVTALQALRDKLSKPVIIVSGYRCRTHNKAVGGASRSLHMQGRAADIRVSGMTARELYAAAKPIPGLRGYGVNDAGGTLHVDVRDYSARWCYRGGKHSKWFEVA